MRKIAANYIFPITGEPIKDGFLEFSDEGTLVSMGRLDSETASTEYYNGILCPGFTNAHCHSELSYMKGMFQKGTGMSGFINQINALRDTTPKQDRISSIEVQFEKMYREGVSAMGDISNCNESFAVKSRSALYTRTFLEVFGSEPEDAEAVMKDVAKLHAEAAAAGIDAAPTPHSPYTMSPGLLQLASAEALREGFLSYHNQESLEEENLLISGTGALAENYRGRGLSTPPVTGKPALFYFLDILQKVHPAPFEEHILLVHNTATNAESVDHALDFLKNVYWVTCPLSNIFIHNQLAPLYLLRSKGAKIAIGTDSLSSNDVLSMVEEIRCLQKNFPDIALDEFLRWACLGGAEAIGKEALYGSFEVGKKSGAVLIDNIDFKDFTLTPESVSKRII